MGPTRTKRLASMMGAIQIGIFRHDDLGIWQLVAAHVCISTPVLLSNKLLFHVPHRPSGIARWQAATAAPHSILICGNMTMSSEIACRPPPTRNGSPYHGSPMRSPSAKTLAISGATSPPSDHSSAPPT